MLEVEFILYVANQEKSRIFYEKLLMIKPSLHVDGMTEFKLFNNVTIGLMPEDGIAKIVSHKMPHPKTGNGIPRCEIYLVVDNPVAYIERGIAIGGTFVSAFQYRNWGNSVGYIADLDGNILAFAQK